MKSAEEWTRGAGSGYITGNLTSDQWVELNAIDFNNLVKQIQLDAWKQGMMDAIERIKANPIAPTHWYVSALTNDIKDNPPKSLLGD